MNVLILVLGILAVISFMTTNRLSGYLDLLVVKREYVRYVQDQERSYLEKRARYAYDKYSRGKGSARQEPNLNRRLNVAPFFQGKDQFDDVILLLLQLLLDDERGSSLFRVLKERVSDPDFPAIRKDADWVKMELGDDLQHEWCNLLAGGYEGNKRLDTYITVESKAKTSVYLANPKLLVALFGKDNDDQVARIIASREAAYLEARRLEKEQRPARREAAAEELERIVGNVRFKGSLDFRVTSTDPRK